MCCNVISLWNFTICYSNWLIVIMQCTLSAGMHIHNISVIHKQVYCFGNSILRIILVNKKRTLTRIPNKTGIFTCCVLDCFETKCMCQAIMYTVQTVTKDGTQHRTICVKADAISSWRSFFFFFRGSITYFMWNNAWKLREFWNGSSWMESKFDGEIFPGRRDIVG